MKKILMSLTLLLSLSQAKADILTDQIDAAFVGHAKLSTEFVTQGKTKVQFLDNFLEIGHFKGEYLAATDVGAEGTILPSGLFAGANVTTGGKIHLAPILKTYLTLPPEWQFLKTLEIDARASYDWRAHHPFYGLALSYPFK